MRRVIFLVILTVVIFAAYGYVAVYLPQTAEHKQVRDMIIQDVDLEQIPDGTYQGSFNYASFTYLVEVKITDHKFENIKVLQNRESKHAKEAEGVITRVQRNQTLQVDTISGATTTSKALLKAIENALTLASQKQN
ncbi:MAG: FMN-binding protein [Clostridiales bacterium]|jgi:uncharacterized protein with FMN-binding domain|nr:FMN-binding protein [Clostridiales bacterium]